MKDMISLLKETASKWSAHQAPRLGASVAFYSVLSFAPLLILLVTLAGLVFDPQTPKEHLSIRPGRPLATEGRIRSKLF